MGFSYYAMYVLCVCVSGFLLSLVRFHYFLNTTTTERKGVKNIYIKDESVDVMRKLLLKQQRQQTKKKLSLRRLNVAVSVFYAF